MQVVRQGFTRHAARAVQGMVAVPMMAVSALVFTPTADVCAAPDETTQADRALAGANGLLQRGMYEQAAADYRAFLKNHGNDAQANVAHYGLGVCLYHLKDMAGSATELDHVAGDKSFQFAADASVLLAQCRLALKEYEPAAAAARRVLKEWPEHNLADDAAVLAVQALAQINQWQEIPAIADQVDQRWPESPHRSRVQWLAAQAGLAAKDDAATRARLESLLKRDPEGTYTARATLVLAQCLHRLNELDAAAARYGEVLKSPTPEVEPEALMGLAALLVQQNRPAEASPLLDRLIDSDAPAAETLRPQALMTRARIGFDAAEYEQAASDFDRAAKLDATLKDQSEYWQAKCDLRTNRPGPAAARLTTAIKEYPASPLLADMSYDRALAMARADDPGAAQALIEFQARFPDHALAPDALHLGASLEHQAGRYEQSMGACSKFASAYDTHKLAGPIVFLAAENLLLLDRTQEAASIYAGFLKKYPDSEQANTARFRLGGALYALDKLDESRPLLEQALQGELAQAQQCSASLMLGDIAFRGSDWPAAERWFAKSMECPEDASATPRDQVLLRLALARQRLDKRDAQVEALTKLIDEFPKSDLRAQALFLRGQARMTAGNVDEARSDFEQIANASAASAFAAPALERLAAIAMSRGEYGTAADLARRAIDGVKDDDDVLASAMLTQGLALSLASKPDAAAPALQAFVEQFPKHDRAAEATAHLAIAEARLNKHEDALKHLDAALAAPPASLGDDLRATLLYERAWCLRNLKRPDDAVNAYAVLLDQSSVQSAMRGRALLELAELQTQAEKPDEAAKALRSLLDVADSQGNEVAAEVKEQALYRLALIESQAGHDVPAAELCERLIKEYPQSQFLASSHQVAAEALVRASRFGQAVDHLTALLALKPADDVRGPALLRLGECQAQVQKWDASREAYEIFLRDFPESDLWFHARFGIGWAYENAGNHDKALEAYRQVTAKHDGATAARAQFQVGECLFAQQKLDEALGELLKVDILYDAPEWAAAALFEAGRCLEGLKRSDEAQQQYRALVQKYPQSQWAQMASSRLQGAGNAGGNSGGAPGSGTSPGRSPSIP